MQKTERLVALGNLSTRSVNRLLMNDFNKTSFLMIPVGFPWFGVPLQVAEGDLPIVASHG